MRQKILNIIVKILSIIIALVGIFTSLFLIVGTYSAAGVDSELPFIITLIIYALPLLWIVFGVGLWRLKSWAIAVLLILASLYIYIVFFFYWSR